MTETTAFARPDLAEGTLWIETPPTHSAMTALFSLLDLARRDDPGWQPMWVVCGPPGVGKSALGRRFAIQAQRSSACDAVREAEERLGGEMRRVRRRKRSSIAIVPGTASGRSRRCRPRSA